MAITDVAGAVKRSPLIVGAAGSEKAAINLAILKEYYIPGIRDLLNSRTVALKLLKRAERWTMSGQYANVPLRIGRNEGLGHIAERGALPDPGTQQYDRAQYWLTYFYGRIKFSGPSVDATENSEGSYLEIMDAEATGLAQDMARELNRVVYGDGSGRLCAIISSGTVTTATCTYPGGFANTGPGTQYLREGMRVAIINTTSTPVILATRTITTVTRSTNTVTFDSSVAWAGVTAAYLVRASNTTPALGDTSWLTEPWGFAAIFSEDNPYRAGATTEYLGQINRSNVPAWRAIQLDNGGSAVPFYPSYLQKGLDDVAQQGDGNVSTFLMSYGLRLSYLDTFSGGRTYPETMDFDGGFRTLSYAGRACVPDRDMTRGWIYGVDWDVVRFLFGKDFDFMDKDGSYLHRLPNEDAYQATIYRYHQVVTDAPNRLLVIKDLQDV